MPLNQHRVARDHEAKGREHFGLRGLAHAVVLDVEAREEEPVASGGLTKGQGKGDLSKPKLGQNLSKLFATRSNHEPDLRELLCSLRRHQQ